MFLHTNTSVAAAMVDSAAIPVVLRWDSGAGFGPDPTVGVSSGMTWLSLLVSTCTLLVLSCSFWWCWLCKTKKRRKEVKLRAKYFKTRLNEEWSSNINVVEKTKLFPLKLLKKATNNFTKDRILGEGGQGTVYKGMLTNGQIIAVKKPKAFDERQWKEFINEVVLLSRVNHRNVVRLLGCCLETKAPMLVYEYISNGTLSQHIHGSKEVFISWETRKRIACEAAGAISYLHSSLSAPIYHRDIKSVNILLDENFQAKVADFGISKAIPLDKTHMTTNIQGTFGYLDPEYFRSGRFSEKSDVYSFGVILVELLTGQHSIRETTLEGEKSLVVYFTSSVDTSALDEILDPVVLEGSNVKEVMLIADLAKRCLKPRGTERPTMKEVAVELEGLRKTLSSTPNVARQASLEIQNVATKSTSPMAVVHTSPIKYKDVRIEVENSDDEQPLCSSSW